MRPKGVVRQALGQAAARLAEERGGASWRAIASAATITVDDSQRYGAERVQRGVAPSLARQTVKNMVHAGELVEVGREKLAGSFHWHALYAPADRVVADDVVDGCSLHRLLADWTR